MSEYTKEQINKANELSDLWDELEENMGEMAALDCACEQLGIDKDNKWNVLEPINECKTGEQNAEV